MRPYTGLPAWLRVVKTWSLLPEECLLASEDIGNANPTALILANNTFQAVSIIGNPESRIILSQCAVYLANSAKSNASYQAINEAQKTVRETGDLSVPLHLRNAPTKLMKDLDYGKEYKYAHNYDDNFIDQEFLPDEIKNTKLYEPGNNPRENQFRELLRKRWETKYNYWTDHSNTTISLLKR